MRVAVIGAGPSGLVTLKYLLNAHFFFPIEPIEARIFEAEDGIGGTFRYRTYENAELVSSKQLTTFSDFRIPADKTEYKDFLSAPQYLEYLEKYCDRFRLRPHISLSTRINQITRGKVGGHVVTHTTPSGAEEQWACDAVAVCSGLHVKPVVPRIPGIEKVPVSMHSSEFKERGQFGVGTNVAVLGSGETGMDLAYLAVTSPTNSVVLCHRSGFCWAPKSIENYVVMGELEKKPPLPPIDVSAASLFDTMYIHDKLKNAPWLWEYYDKFTKLTWLAVNGTKYGYGQHVGMVPDERFHLSRVIFNKSTAAVPYINQQYYIDNSAQRYRQKFIDLAPVDTKGRKIELAPFPEYIDAEGYIKFRDTGRKESVRMQGMNFKPDVVVFATGYEHKFPFLGEDYPHSDDADVRAIWKSGDESVGFIGFVRPALGAIPPLAEFQAQLWTQALLDQLPAPLHPQDHYKLDHLPNQRIQHGVDHETYAYTLACDMGSAPSFSQIVRYGFKMVLIWAMSANFNTKFRLVGPWRWSGAEEVMRIEIWDTIARRYGFFGHFTLNILPMMIFGTLSFWYWIFYGFLDVIEGVKGAVLEGRTPRTHKAASIQYRRIDMYAPLEKTNGVNGVKVNGGNVLSGHARSPSKVV